MNNPKTKILSAIAASLIAVPALAEAPSHEDLQARLDAAEARIAELSSNREETWLESRRSEEVKALVKEVLADADSRASFQGAPMTGVFPTKGNAWSLKLGGFVQTRYSYNSGGSVEANHGFSIPRARLIFEGNVLDVGYKVSGQFSDGGDFELKDAYGTFDLFGLDTKFGQFKAPFMKEVLVSQVDTLAADRSIVAYTFGQGRSQGIEFGKDFGALNLRAAYTDGFNSANGAGIQNGYALTARADWDVTDWWNLGAAISWNDLVDTDYWTYTVDTGLDVSGLELTAAFTGINRDAGNDWATTFSAAYQCMDNLQGFVAYEYGRLEGANDDLSIATIGANYWLNDNVKWTTDIGYSFNGIGSGWNVADTGWNTSATSGEYLVRTQLQIQF